MAAFSREQIPRAFAAFGPAMGLSAVLGPIVAGFIITANLAGLDWRPIFLINIVLGTTGLVAALILLPHDKPVSQERIDALGSGLLGTTMLALIFGLIQGSTSGWTALPVVSLIAGVLLFVGFGFRQARAANPLIVPSLLKNRGFTLGAAARAVHVCERERAGLRDLALLPIGAAPDAVAGRPRPRAHGRRHRGRSRSCAGRCSGASAGRSW